MIRWLTIGLCTLLLSGEVYAGKGASPPAGRSYSNGSSSSSFKPSSSSSSTFKPSAPSANSGFGRSYSTGGPPKASPPPPPPPPPAQKAAGSGGKQYTNSSNTPPPAPFSGGSSTRPNPPPPPVQATRTNPTPQPNAGAAKSNWNSGLTAARQKEDSEKAYKQAQAPPKQVTKPADTPRSSYVTPKGEEKPIKADDPAVTTVRKNVTYERYVTYESRASTFYPPVIYSHPQPYSDVFSPFLMGYLFSEAVNSHQRATWAYNHQRELVVDGVPTQRYRDMMEKDRDLEARVRELEKQNAGKRDEGYVLPSMKDNPEFQYDQKFIESSLNPTTTTIPDDSNNGNSGITFLGFFKFLTWVFVIGLVILVVWVGVYYFAIKDWPDK